MAQERLFDDLPPAIARQQDDVRAHPSPPPKLPPPKPALKPALKRSSQTEEHDDDTKRVRFKTTVDASISQIADAMRKIASHIGNPNKFSKASKLALQLLQSGGVNKDTSDLFFDILKASMAAPATATHHSIRHDYHELFSTVSEHLQCFSPSQQAQLEVWIIWAQVANDFFTDDSFVFSKAANKVKQHISLLPEATPAEDMSDTMGDSNAKGGALIEVPPTRQDIACEKPQMLHERDVDNDPFGLDSLLPQPSKKEERLGKRRDEEVASRKAREEAAAAARLFQQWREALMLCLEIAAGRYRVIWAQTIIDILVKHAFDNMVRFTAQQRAAIEKLWGSVREQQIRRKQGKGATGKLDVTGFERFQSKYSQAKISIRHSVGADGDRSAEQWLG